MTEQQDDPDAGRPAYRAVVVVASTRAASGAYQDRTGPVIVATLREWGYAVPDAVVVPDGPAVGAALESALADRPAVILTTGGTGISPTDTTPEVTRGLLERDVPGIAEAIRAAGVAQGVPTAMLSRGLSGVVGQTLVVNLPGSSGGVKDALEVLAAVLPHAVDQIRGGDHR